MEYVATELEQALAELAKARETTWFRVWSMSRPSRASKR